MYENIGISEIINNITNVIGQFIAHFRGNFMIGINKDFEREKKQPKRLITFLKFTTSLGTVNKKKDYAKATLLKMINIEDRIIKKFDTQRHIINFQNGIMDLKTGEFRERTEEDYVLSTIPFDYVEESKMEKKYWAIKDHVYETLFRVCNNSIETIEATLLFFGYCLTGESDQKLLLLI